MRILILAPKKFPNISGNAITAERWRRALIHKGMVAEVLATEQLTPSSLLRHLQQFRPDIIHAHHAFKAGALLVHPSLREQLANLPFVTSPGGTDIHLDLLMPENRETVLQVFQMAQRIIAQSDEIVQSFRGAIQHLFEKVVYVPKGIFWFGSGIFDLRCAAACKPGDILFFLPAGVRRVKRNLECLEAMEHLHRMRQNVRFIAAGPEIEAEYAGRFEEAIHRNIAFARWVKAIPSQSMRSAYEASDVVLNASFSEGLSNCLIEAVAAGRPVLASDIPGNHLSIAGEDGNSPATCLFDLHNPGDFVEKALRLVDDKEYRQSLSQGSILRKSLLPTAEDEADGLIQVYKAAVEYKGL